MKPALDFIVTGLPRSGTTWLANALTRNKVLCLHDPLFKMHYDDLGEEAAKLRSYGYRKVGIACTGIWQFPEYLNEFKGPLLILHRELPEINKSLRALGLPEHTDEQHRSLFDLNGKHVHFSKLFDYRYFPDITKFLKLGANHLDFKTHEQLTELMVQPNFAILPERCHKVAVQRLIAELASKENENGN